MRRLLLLCCLALPALHSAPAWCAAKASETFTTDKLTASDAWATVTKATGDSRGYVTITNDGDADELDGVTCTDALGATMNEPNAKTGSAGLMAPLGTDLMPVLLKVQIPAHGSFQFKPGGRYLKFENMAYELKPGMQVFCTLTFSTNGPLDVQFTVAQPPAGAPAS
jgi:copper(I)-binding protein